MRPLAIINPASGGGRCGRLAPRAIAALAARGRDFDSVVTAGPRDASKLAARAYAEGRRVFIAMGGDGALFEVVNGLAPVAFADPDLLVCVAPLGTGNSLVRDLPGASLENTSDEEARAKARSIDLLHVVCRETSFYCANMISFGFAADVGRTVNDHLKPLGPAGYSIGVVWRVASLAPHLLPYRIPGADMRRDRLTLLSVANSRYTGAGMMMAPAARIDDGRMDVVSGAHMGRLKLLRLFPKIFDGSHVGHPAVRQETTETLEFAVDAPIGMIADGEFIEATPLRIEIVPRAIRMLAIELPK